MAHGIAHWKVEDRCSRGWPLASAASPAPVQFRQAAQVRLSRKARPWDSRSSPLNAQSIDPLPSPQLSRCLSCSVSLPVLSPPSSSKRLDLGLPLAALAQVTDTPRRGKNHSKSDEGPGNRTAPTPDRRPRQRQATAPGHTESKVAGLCRK
jgi:hypothetical protein